MTVRPLFALALLATTAAAHGEADFTRVDSVFNAEASAASVLLADFNGDGSLDAAAVSNSASLNNKMNVALRGSAAGWFAGGVAYYTGAATHPWGIAAGDWDGDGDIDLATTNLGNGSGGSVTIFLNDGTGNFDTSTLITGVTVGATKPVVVDVDSDGDLDILTASATTGSTLLNNGSGTFAVSAGPGAVLAAGDVNDDGNVDVVVRSPFGVRLGNGDGTFAAATAYTPGSTTVNDAELADLDGDGYLDLVTIGQSYDVASVFMNNGSGGFGAAANYGLHTQPYDLAIGDLDNDGDPDIVTANKAGQSFAAIYNDGTGNFGDGSWIWPLDSEITGVAIGDLNADGYLDIVLADGGRTAVYQNTLGPDTIPDGFWFGYVEGAIPGTVVESDTVEITGLGAAAPIIVFGGEYRVNGGSYTSEPGTVNNGDMVQARQTAADTLGTATRTTVAIGGIRGDFDVVTEQETVPPTVLSVNPANLATNVPVNRVVTVRFSEPVNCATVTTASFKLKLGTTAVAGTVRCSGDTATFTPKVKLGAGKKYTASVSTAVTDLAGNAMTTLKKWSFTTSAAGTSDTIKPKVLSVSPAAGATNVAITTKITVTFSEPVDCSTVDANSFGVLVENALVDGTRTCNGKVATFTPAAALEANTSYTAVANTRIKDLARNVLTATKTWTFTTGSP